jgi:superfamily II DNA/RNA helicase
VNERSYAQRRVLYLLQEGQKNTKQVSQLCTSRRLHDRQAFANYNLLALEQEGLVRRIGRTVRAGSIWELTQEGVLEVA